jgi:hypothetical protein
VRDEIHVPITVEISDVNLMRIVEGRPRILECEVALVVAEKEGQSVVLCIGHDDVDGAVFIKVGDPHLRLEHREETIARGTGGDNARLKGTVAIAQ